jgi:hypothetical protein
VCEYKGLRRIFGLKMDEVVGNRRKLHYDKLHNLYSSPGLFIMAKSRTIRWVGHVERTGKIGIHVGKKNSVV